MDAESDMTALDVAIVNLEEENRQWSRLLDELARAVSEQRGDEVVGRTLDTLHAYTLHAYTKYHFAEEENLQERYHYPRLPQQLHQHAFFLNWVEQARRELANGDAQALAGNVLEMMRIWQMTHITAIDSRFIAYLADRPDLR